MSVDRYARHLALAGFGAAEQARLRAATALVIGAGGLGSPALLYLAAAGIGELVVSDFDTVDVTNLQRQVLFTVADVGRPKAEAAAGHLRELNPDTTVTPVGSRLLDAELLAAVRQADVVLDCTDNFGTRFALNQACVQARKPLVSGAAIRYEGQLAVFRLDRPGGPCYRCLWQEEAEELESCRGNGVLGPVPGVIGSLMAVEALKIASGCAPSADGKLVLYDAVENDWRQLKLERDPACPACGAEQ
ncbi:HesA/MoeB/ThiF family protein [Thioalkalivibrio sp. XN8]|uniref:HesA/MoeB/ThiF family protein n=1 Tax=Thioalkalivibrio sp. XN8 TaxID=2712863 RepID=UPI0013E9DC00|nr:HesA/MoeB/ThiF family protein [Thioalkalivibrio sp. XN8]NGP54162.1 HesA/MoeB/ThiF family protein [Thioalkalivibrio sp. XN8]